jgi:hypothetical protein
VAPSPTQIFDLKLLLEKIKRLETQLQIAETQNQLKDTKIKQLECMLDARNQQIKNLQKSRNSLRHLTLNNDFYDVMSSEATLKSIGKSSKNDAQLPHEKTKYEELNFSIHDGLATKSITPSEF